LHQVFEMVKSEAARHGVGIAGSEIVGLVPQRAIEAAAAFYLQLENFSGTQVFENRMYAAENEILGTAASSFGENKLNAGVPRIEKEFMTQPAETPRGSVPALAITLAQRLTNLSAGLSANAAELQAFAARFDAARRSLAALVDRDAAAFSAVMAAQDSPRAQMKQREGAIQRSLECAAGIQLEVARAAAEIFESLGQLETLSGPPILSDVLAGRAIAASAVRGALENVAIHLESIEDSAFSVKARTELQAIATRVTEGTLAERR
jgi:glutamate formiminotransferase / formiminotetrahydrofolate cyclodeaminase